MAIINGYCTLSEVRLQLGYTNATDTANDAAIEKTIEAASRMIDNWCGRVFYESASDETRYYTPDHYGRIFTDDIRSITSIATDGNGDRTYVTTWAATDYDLMPSALPPYTWIETAPGGDYSFPLSRMSVKIVGKFGYSETGSPPKPIVEACLIQSIRLFKRTKDAPFGIAGASDMGQAIMIAKFDPDVEMLLTPYRRLV